MTSRLLMVHAHPDDETSQTGSTLARYAAEGQVTLVTCTLGEVGEIVDDELKAVVEPGMLGAYRLGELTAAMAELGVTDFLRLGGDHKYRDSGMKADDSGKVMPVDDLDPASFWNADLLEAATDLVEIIRDRRPQVLTTYDMFGGYGHPDHVQAHRVTMYAYVLAGSESFRPDLGRPWRVSRVLWSAWDADTVRDMFVAAQSLGLDTSWVDPDAELPPIFTPHEFIAARVAETPWMPQTVAALSKYRSQVKLDDPWWQLMKVAPGLERFEAYRFVAGVDFPQADEPASDLFLGLDLDD